MYENRILTGEGKETHIFRTPTTCIFVILLVCFFHYKHSKMNEYCWWAVKDCSTINKWAVSGKKVPSSMHKMCEFTSSGTCARSPSDLCSLLIHSLVSNDSGSRQQRPRSDCTSVQSDLGLRCPCMPQRHAFAWHSSNQTDGQILT